LIASRIDAEASKIPQFVDEINQLSGRSQEVIFATTSATYEKLLAQVKEALQPLYLTEAKACEMAKSTDIVRDFAVFRNQPRALLTSNAGCLADNGRLVLDELNSVLEGKCPWTFKTNN
jgi:hypothetical protein